MAGQGVRNLVLIIHIITGACSFLDAANSTLKYSDNAELNHQCQSDLDLQCVGHSQNKFLIKELN